MPKILKARHKTNNQPPDFAQTFAPTFDSADPLALAARPRLRYLAYAAWAVATVIVGIAAGTLISRSQVTAAAAVTPTPVADQAALSVMPQTSAAVLPPAMIPSSSLAVSSASAVGQAAGGTPYATISAGVYQPEVSETALNPGFTNDGTLQGTVGTAPVQ